MHRRLCDERLHEQCFALICLTLVASSTVARLLSFKGAGECSSIQPGTVSHATHWRLSVAITTAVLAGYSACSAGDETGVLSLNLVLCGESSPTYPITLTAQSIVIRSFIRFYHEAFPSAIRIDSTKKALQHRTDPAMTSSFPLLLALKTI